MINDGTPLPSVNMVTLMHARTGAESAVVAALLRSAAIPFHVDGRLLVDEFAISQRMLGLTSEISVRAEDLQRAQALLEQARESGRELGSGGADDEG